MEESTRHKPIRMLVGLGNPGKKYENTRHNCGFDFVAKLVRETNANLTLEKRFNALVAQCQWQGFPLHCCCPQTYMNCSGQAVQSYMHYFRLQPEEILVIHDELDFSSGELRLKFSGGHGGHNGLRDIINCIGTADFFRMRVGIGQPERASAVTGYVLSLPSREQSKQIEEAMQAGLSALKELLVGDVDAAFRLLH
jgi:peptidyl-tRNA hydrolase, PTH1 family